VNTLNSTDKAEHRSPEEQTAPSVASYLYRWGGTVMAIFVGGMLILLTYYLLVKLQRVLWIFALSFLVAYFLEPLIQRLQKVGWSRTGAVWAVLGAVVLVMVLTGWAVIPALVNQVQDAAQNWAQYSDQATTTYEQLRSKLYAWIGRLYPQVGVTNFLDSKIPEAQEWLAENVPVMLEWTSRQLVTSLGLLGLTVIVLILSFHFMMLAETLRATVQQLIPRRHSAKVEAVGSEIGTMLGQYLRGIVVLFFANAIGAVIIMSALSLFFGNKYALVVGVLTGITNMVPYVGPVVSAGSAGYLTYVTAQPNTALLASMLATGLMLLMSQYFAIVVQPKLIGRRINLHPLVILFAMFAGYELFGLIGVIIGMPIAAVIKIILAKWIPVIGPGPEVRASSEPLLLDISQGMRNVWTYLQRLYGRNADTDEVNPDAESACQESPEADTAESHQAGDNQPDTAARQDGDEDD